MRQNSPAELSPESESLLRELIASTEDLMAHTLVAGEALQAAPSLQDAKNHQKYQELYQQLAQISGKNISPLDSDYPQEASAALEQWEETAQHLRESYVAARDFLPAVAQKQYDAVIKQIDAIASSELSSAEAKTYALLFAICTLLWVAGGTFQTITHEQFQAEGVSQLYNFFEQTLGNRTAEFMLGQLGVVGEPVSVALIVNRLRHNEKSREEILKSIRFFSALMLLHELLSFGNLAIKNPDQTFYPDVADVLVLSIPLIASVIFQKIAQKD